MKTRGFRTLEAVSVLVFAALVGGCTSRAEPSTARASAKTVREVARRPHTNQGRVFALGKSNYPVEPHETFAIALVGDEFERAADAGGVDLAFDARAARVLAVKVDANTWELAAPRAHVDNTAGNVTGIMFASASARSGRFPIASVVFESVTADEIRPLELKLTESAIRPFSSQGQRVSVAFE